MNVLYQEFPEYLEIDGEKYPIETDFREWIRFSALVEDEEISWITKIQLMMQWFLEKIPDDLEAAIYAMGDFLTAKRLYRDDPEENLNKERDLKPAFSFEEDAGCIYSAFVECYGIDLQTVHYMHWWKFKTLFDWLPEETEIKQRIKYRTTDTNTIKDPEERKRVRRIQEAIALRKKKRILDDYEIGDVFA